MRDNVFSERWDRKPDPIVHQGHSYWERDTEEFGNASLCGWLPRAVDKWQPGRDLWWVSLCLNDTNDRSKAEFDSHVRKWRDETEDFSILAIRFAHASYLRIIGLGHIAIPWILDELRSDPDWWFEALKAISGEDPASQAGSFDDAVEAWLQWGSGRRYA